MCDVIQKVPYSTVSQSFNINANKEYIVFLNMGYLCSSTTNSYFAIEPMQKRGCIRDGSQTIRPLLALPIEEGKVNESGSGLNVGSNLIPAQYIAKLKERRDQILNLTNTIRKDEDKGILNKSLQPKLTQLRK